MRAMIGFGVAAGGSTPPQVVTLKPGNVSAMVGTSGKNEDLLAPLTAMQRSLPARTYCSVGLVVSNATSICPPIRSLSTGAVPL